MLLNLRNVSRLYLNPVTGHLLRIGLRTAVRIAAGLDEHRQLTPSGPIHLVTATPFLPMWVDLKTVLWP